MNKQPFKDLKVLELAAVLAGPAVGLFFAELGAEVIKVENRTTGGDITRRWRLPSEDTEAPVSAYYCAINWGKTVWQLDLRDPNDRDRVYTAAREADIVVTNFKAGSAAKLGMDADTLRALNPRLIYGSITGFGDSAERVAFDVVLQAESGFLYMNGQPDGPPTKMPVALIDILAAHQLKQGLLVALLERYRTGEGATVSVSLFESAVAALANQATNWLMVGHVPQRLGSQHPNIAPYGELFRTQDQRWVILAIGSDRQFKALCTVLGHPEWAVHPDYATNIQRVRNREGLAALLRPSFVAAVAADILEPCHQAQVPIGLVRDMPAVFEHPLAQGMILEEEIEGMVTKRVRTVVF